LLHTCQGGVFIFFAGGGVGVEGGPGAAEKGVKAVESITQKTRASAGGFWAKVGARAMRFFAPKAAKVQT